MAAPEASDGPVGEWTRSFPSLHLAVGIETKALATEGLLPVHGVPAIPIWGTWDNTPYMDQAQKGLFSGRSCPIPPGTSLVSAAQTNAISPWNHDSDS